MKKSLKLVAVIVAFMLIQVTAAEAWTLTLRARACGLSSQKNPNKKKVPK